MDAGPRAPGSFRRPDHVLPLGIGARVRTMDGVSLRAWIMTAGLLLGAPAVFAESANMPPDHDHDSMMSVAPGFSPQLTLHGFSDVTFRIDRSSFPGGRDSTSSGFGLGQFDLYLVSRLADHFSFLGETVFELGPDGETGVDVERVFIKYTWSDLFRLAAGRSHTALGYWNEAFHHGALLQPTVERPEALKFEDDGGILPVHSVGVELSGRAHSGDWGFDYVANLANGRGATRDAVQGGGDLNRDKAVALKFTLSRERESTVAIGPALYRDLIPGDPATPGREGEIREVIPGGHFFYRDQHAEVLGEAYGIRHHDDLTGRVFYHRAGYLVASLREPRWKPYFGIEAIDYAPGDPFFAPDDSDLDRFTVGLRVEPNSFNAVKVEFRHDRRAGADTDALLVQTAFTF